MKKEVVEKILEKKSLTEKELQVLRDYEPNDGTNRLYSFFTPLWLCEVMYKLAIRYGFDPSKGKILEPACGTGNFLEVLDKSENCTAFELDPLNFRIAQKRAPKVKHFFNSHFETAFLKEPRFTSVISSRSKDITWLKDYPFDLVIGNPPYGKYNNFYSSYFKNLRIKQVELFFFYQSLRLLKKGGLLAFITGSNFLRNNNTYEHEKKLMGKYAEMIDAYRMPKVFKNTSVPTDIIILKRI